MYICQCEPLYAYADCAGGLGQFVSVDVAWGICHAEAPSFHLTSLLHSFYNASLQHSWSFFWWVLVESLGLFVRKVVSYILLSQGVLHSLQRHSVVPS